MNPPLNIQDKAFQSHVFNAAREVMEIIRSRGCICLIVGGAVRDLLWDREIKDLDLATDMKPRDLARLFRTYHKGKSKYFETVCVVYREKHFETTMFRGQELSRMGPAPPQEKKPLAFALDALHRDFTINAMALDEDFILLDPYHGLQDLSNGIIRGVENPRERILEDELRILRGLRLAAELKMDLEHETARCFRDLGGRLNRIAPERKGEELLKMASLPGSDFARALELMDELGILAKLLPEIQALKRVPCYKSKPSQGNTFRHTLAAIQANTGTDPSLNLALLVQDVGKIGVLNIREHPAVYPGHGRSGLPLVKAMASRFKLPSRTTRAMLEVVANHMRMHKIHLLYPSQISRLIQNPCWPVLRAASICDQDAQEQDGGIKQKKRIQRAINKVSRFLSGRNQDTLQVRPVITGRQVLKYTGIYSGPMVGRIIRETTDWALDNYIQDETRILEQAKYLAGLLQKNNGD